MTRERHCAYAHLRNQTHAEVAISEAIREPGTSRVLGGFHVGRRRLNASLQVNSQIGTLARVGIAPERLEDILLVVFSEWAVTQAEPTLTRIALNFPQRIQGRW